MTMVGLIEAEITFFNEASHIMNFFTNVRSNSIGLKKTLIPLNTKYDAFNYIKGKFILNMSVEEIFNPNYQVPLQQPPGVGNGISNQNQNQNQTNNTQLNNAIINPFTSNSGDIKNNNSSNYNNSNNNDNNIGQSKNANMPNNFMNKSTRDTFALNNPYNTQANPYSGSSNNFPPQTNLFESKDNKPFSDNNNINNPYNGNNFQNQYGNSNPNPYDNNNNQNNNDNNEDDPFDF